MRPSAAASFVFAVTRRTFMQHDIIIRPKHGFTSLAEIAKISLICHIQAFFNVIRLKLTDGLL
jgi:hypothetical protein